MTGAGFNLPGQLERPTDWTPTPTTLGRSWAELIETLQGGLAVVDKNWRLVYVSDRFLSALGNPEDLIGYELRDLLPALTGDDPRRLQHQLDRGRRVEFEHQSLTSDDERSWHRLTVLPCTELGDDLAAVVFAKDITPTSRTLARVRDATVALTNVESELHRRVGRYVHDGPVQLLAALMFQLGLSKTDEANTLEQIVAEVASVLRNVIEEFSTESRGDRGTLLEQWIAPLLLDTGIEVKVKDLRTAESGMAETQAAFVFVYRTVRGVRDPSLRRTINVTMTDEHGGERIVLTSPSMQPAMGPPAGLRGAQLRATTHHARALGGTFSTWLDPNDVRSVSMWIPKLDQLPQTPTEPTKKKVPLEVREPQIRTWIDMSLLPALSNAAWIEIAGGAPERLLEYDAQMRISFANAAQHEVLNVGLDQLVGLSADQIFAAEHLAHLADDFGRLDAGEFIAKDWYRTSQLGDSRLIHMTLSPRLDETGTWLGLLGVSEDRTDLGFLDDVHQSTLADLTFARRLAFEASIQRLEEPLARCEQLINGIEQFERTSPEPGAVRSIRFELIAALGRIRSSTSALTPPPSSIGDLHDALHQSLATLLESRELLVADTTGSPVSAAVTETVFRITREAINNAVLHGDADCITITLSDTNDGTTCTIHDDGIGVTTKQLKHQPGHLGTRAMRERARERGGTCRIERDPRGGTLVSVWLPHAAPSTRG